MRLLFFVLLCILIVTWKRQTNADELERSFRVDYANDSFLKDGKPFRFIAGSIHYFRSLPQTWSKKLRTLRAAGLNAVTTYVEWSLHNPRDGEYVWDGIADLEKFIRLATEEDLLVILRPGPYICAERDMGGFPYWLLRKYPDISLRTTDSNYMNEVKKWYNVLMPRMQPFLYENGGPIIMVQVENEYGSFGCDHEYMNQVKKVSEEYVQGKAVLFTNDGPYQVRCGKTEGVLATLDFDGTKEQIDENWQTLRRYQPNGPLVNAEYYPGWLTHWQEQLAHVGTQRVLTGLKAMLDANASVNFYMFHGGTNFGFTAGANTGGIGGYTADLTSYDYDAPMDESGDPTPKYMSIRDTLKEYNPMPDIPVPPRTLKAKYLPIQLKPKSLLLSAYSRETLGKIPIHATTPLTFEALDQNYGFVLYETKLPKLKLDPSLISIPGLRDRAHVLIDNHLIGVLSRENNILNIPISAGSGLILQIFVENQGRINYGIANDFKGIIGDVSISNSTLLNWTMTGFPLDDYSKIDDVILRNDIDESTTSINLLRMGPAIFHGKLVISKNELADTYINPINWGKGLIFVNGFNLGRHWPLVGPQVTLYLPKEILHEGENAITLIELQRAPEDGMIGFVNEAQLEIQ